MDPVQTSATPNQNIEANNEEELSSAALERLKILTRSNKELFDLRASIDAHRA